MVKKLYLWAIASQLLIPAVAVLIGFVFVLIDPEIARNSENYARNYQLLETLQKIVLLAGLLTCIGLWFTSCFLIVKSKLQPWGWCLIGILGPLGLIVLTLLNDREPAQGDIYQQFLKKLWLGWRVLLELAIFSGFWLLAYQAMTIKRDLLILAESARTGVSVEKIVAEQLATSGMRAFGEALEIFLIVTLIYLLWPLVVNMAINLKFRLRGR